MPNLKQLLLVCLVSGCGDSISVNPILGPCMEPQKLPDRALSDREIEIYWGRDRAELRSCGEKVKILEPSTNPQ